MTQLYQNPPPERALTFYKGLTRTKNGVMLIFGAAKPGVCLHYETQQTSKQEIYINIKIMKAIKYAVALFSMITLTVGISTVALANDEGKKDHPTELKFIGNVDHQPVFQLDLANAQEDEIIVTFVDESGNVLFSDKFKGANISKKFMLKSEELGDAALNVTVRSVKNNTTEVYAINRSHSYVDETVVNKVK
jgi:hypothetical protein